MNLSLPATGDFSTLLAAEVNVLEEFVALLRREEAYLIEPVDIDALVGLVGAKNDVASRLAEATASREAHLGEGDRKQLMADRLRREPAASPARRSWARLLELAAEAQRLNETNGKLIQLHLQHNQSALLALMNAGNQLVPYGADGQQRTRGGNRLLGSA